MGLSTHKIQFINSTIKWREREKQAVNALIKKCSEKKKNPYLNLQELSKSVDKVGKSSAQLLMSRCLKTLPTSHCSLYTHTENPSIVQKGHADCQKCQ